MLHANDPDHDGGTRAGQTPTIASSLHLGLVHLPGSLNGFLDLVDVRSHTNARFVATTTLSSQLYPFLPLSPSPALSPVQRTHLAAEDDSDLVQPSLGIENLPVQNGLGQKVDMANLAALDIRRKEVDGLAERLADGRGGTEHLGVAADAKDADVDVFVGVLGEVLLDLFSDL